MFAGMCNLYSQTKGQEAIRKLAGVMRDSAGNLPPLPGIFPDKLAPVVRNAPDGVELAMLRWGMPSPPEPYVQPPGAPGSPHEMPNRRAHRRPDRGPSRYVSASADQPKFDSAGRLVKNHHIAASIAGVVAERADREP
jgi:hypothetical protein